MKKKVMFLFNPEAGNNAIEKTVFDIIKNLTIFDCEVTVFPIMPDKGLGSEEILINHASEFETIVVYGGDGTLNRVVNIMMHQDIHLPIGYIPGGTTNDFSKAIDENGTIESYCRTIAFGKPFSYDVGCFNGTFFNYVAAFGAFTATSYETSRESKKILGYGAYVLNALGNLPASLSNRTKMKFIHDGVEEEGTFVFGAISNSPSVGGFKLPFYEDSTLDDGKFEVLLVAALDNLEVLHNVLTGVATGNIDPKYVHAFKTDKIEFICEEDTAWTLDGEHGGKHRTVTIEIHPKSMTIMTSKS